MSCGHKLLHYTSRCQSSVPAKKLCEELLGPKQSIDDSCAACHPEHVMYEINMYHDWLQHELMAFMRGAKTKEEDLKIEREIVEAEAVRGRKLRAASRLKWNGEVVWIPSGEKSEN
ncbi:hypothetical protein IFR05_004880 [Cadophora sp. M221]|nr:hypothetical protein IFR05_004880 [Cadophora sp. M221]